MSGPWEILARTLDGMLQNDTVAASTVGRLILFTTLITAVRVLVRIGGFVPTMQLLGWLPRLGSTLVGPDPRWAKEIDVVAAPPLGGSCLDRSILMWFVMRQHGLDADLRVGVRREPTGNGDGGELVAHAWVEYFGLVVNDDPGVATSYVVFDGDVARLAFT